MSTNNSILFCILISVILVSGCTAAGNYIPCEEKAKQFIPALLYGIPVPNQNDAFLISQKGLDLIVPRSSIMMPYYGIPIGVATYNSGSSQGENVNYLYCRGDETACGFTYSKNVLDNTGVIIGKNSFSVKLTLQLKTDKSSTKLPLGGDPLSTFNEYEVVQTSFYSCKFSD